WIDKAERGLEAGMEYSHAIRNRRVRTATVLPALIGMRTIALLRKAGAEALEQNVKVPRREVRRMIFFLVISFASRKVIDDLVQGTTAWVTGHLGSWPAGRRPFLKIIALFSAD